MKSLLILGMLLVSFSAFVYAAGDLDPLFGAGGKVVTDLGGGETGFAMALQPDGKIIIGGATGNPSDFALVRYNPNGTLDPTFGAGGTVLLDFLGELDFLTALALQSDGKIVAAGITRADSASPLLMVLSRFNPNGTLDPTFGSGGKVTVTLPDVSFGVNSIALDSVGKIVVVGAVSTFNQVLDSQCFVARFNPNGSLDPTFGSGIIIKDFGSTLGNETYSHVTVQTDDKIVVSGSVPGVNSQDLHDFVTVRYNTTGSQDPTFGSGGVVITDFVGGVDNAVGVVVQPDGKILVSGPSSSASNFDFAIVRYNPNGSLDPTFGNGGKVSTDFSNANDFGGAILLQPNGKIIVIGTTGADFGLVRYNPNGSLDPTFGSGGKVITDFSGTNDTARSAALQPDGKIIAAGTTFPAGGGDFALARYNGDILLPPQCGLYSEDFEDGILAADWSYSSPDWAETGGSLAGTAQQGKTEAFADPAFVGCGPGACTVQTTMQTAGGQGSKLFFFAFFLDKQNTVEVVMDEKKDKWVFKQIAGGVVVAKTKGLGIIEPTIPYDVRIAFDGTAFQLVVDGATLATVNAGAAPFGTMGYRVKKTTGKFGNLCAN